MPDLQEIAGSPGTTAGSTTIAVAEPYRYTRVFKPTGAEGKDPLLPPPAARAQTGDQTSGWEYVYTEDIILAVNVALVTGRALLVSGPPGSGKSSLARSVAHLQQWPYLETVVTSHTQARDLLWRFDALRRLSDAQVATDSEARRRVQDLNTYITPGVLWWAFNWDSAMRQIGTSAAPPFPKPAPGDDGALPPVVVLLDEIDKADPDVPNDLLGPLGATEFRVEETDQLVARIDPVPRPLLIITTNGERDLPKPFVRRCVVLALPDVTVPRLVDIATRRYGPDPQGYYEPIARQTVAIAEQARKDKQTPPGTAEFLDAVRTCQVATILPDPDNPTWQAIRRATLEKIRGIQEVS